MSSLMSSSALPVLLQFASIQEAQIAYEAVMAHRQGRSPLENVSGSVSAQDALSVRIQVALASSPLNRPRELILETLLATTPGAWMPYPDLQKLFEQEGLNREQAQAALRDLSWQMKEFLPAEDIAGKATAIEVLAARARTKSVVQYSLTPAGRVAVEKFLGQRTASTPRKG